jgi:hypothetical protein
VPWLIIRHKLQVGVGGYRNEALNRDAGAGRAAAHQGVDGGLKDDAVAGFNRERADRSRQYRDRAPLDKPVDVPVYPRLALQPEILSNPPIGRRVAVVADIPGDVGAQLVLAG